jgi:hypothetical protein
MEAWMPGLMPYSYLLPSQFVIIAVLARAALDLSRGPGSLHRKCLGGETA